MEKPGSLFGCGGAGDEASPDRPRSKARHAKTWWRALSRNLWRKRKSRLAGWMSEFWIWIARSTVYMRSMAASKDCGVPVFGGMSEAETAEVLGMGVRTVRRDWAWRELGSTASCIRSLLQVPLDRPSLARARDANRPMGIGKDGSLNRLSTRKPSALGGLLENGGCRDSSRSRTPAVAQQKRRRISRSAAIRRGQAGAGRFFSVLKKGKFFWIASRSCGFWPRRNG